MKKLLLLLLFLISNIIFADIGTSKEMYNKIIISNKPIIINGYKEKKMMSSTYTQNLKKMMSSTYTQNLKKIKESIYDHKLYKKVSKKVSKKHMILIWYICFIGFIIAIEIMIKKLYGEEFRNVVIYPIVLAMTIGVVGTILAYTGLVLDVIGMSSWGCILGG